VGKIEVYKKQYKKKEQEDYYNLIKEIKTNSFDESNEERRYFTFEEKVFIKISPEFSTSSFNKFNSAKMTIEKIGPTANEESQIEKMLLEKGFKKETP